MVPGSRFWVPGSGSGSGVLGSCCHGAASRLRVPSARSQGPKPSGRPSTLPAPTSTCVRSSSFGPRPAGSPAIERTRGYIIDQLEDARQSPSSGSRSRRRRPSARSRWSNLIATIPGARQERIAIAGHYDTKLFREFRFVGANDGGSSTAFLIEMARVLKARPNPFTIELIFFDGEEATLRDWGETDHTYGSQYYVDAARKAGTLSTLKALVLVDMIAERSPRFLRESQLDALAHRHHLVHGAEHGPRRGLRQRQHADRRRPRAVPAKPACRPPTSSTSTIRRGTPPADTLDQTSARSLQIVGDVVVASLAPIEARLKAGNRALFTTTAIRCVLVESTAVVVRNRRR